MRGPWRSPDIKGHTAIKHLGHYGHTAVRRGKGRPSGGRCEDLPKWCTTFRSPGGGRIVNVGPVRPASAAGSPPDTATSAAQHRAADPARQGGRHPAGRAHPPRAHRFACARTSADSGTTPKARRPADTAPRARRTADPPTLGSPFPGPPPPDVCVLSRPVLVAGSRTRFLGHVLADAGGTPPRPLPPHAAGALSPTAARRVEDGGVGPAKVVRSEFCGWNCMVCARCRRLAKAHAQHGSGIRRARESPLMRIRSGIAAALTAICVSIAPAPSAQAAEPDFGWSDSTALEQSVPARGAGGDDHMGQDRTSQRPDGSVPAQGLGDGGSHCPLSPTQYGAMDWPRGIGYSRTAGNAPPEPSATEGCTSSSTRPTQPALASR
ncbi:hypothetical protein EDD96_0029 [Streptomyces sp. Ag109_G2-6]|nr:hypothetical protein EDD96_0029 [Streptomyces sp. Ag109_G2-6]